MRRAIRLFLFIACCTGMHLASWAQCDYTLELRDAGGDGWGGWPVDAALQVEINSVPLDTFSLASGSDTTIVLSVNDTDTITTVYTHASGGGGAGVSNWENGYVLRDNSGVVVIAGIGQPLTTVTREIVVDCDGPDGSCVHFAELFDSDSSSWDRAFLTVSRPGDTLRFSIEDTLLTYEIFGFYVSDGQNVTVEYTRSSGPNPTNAYAFLNSMYGTLYYSDFNPDETARDFTVSCMDACLLNCPSDTMLVMVLDTCGAFYSYDIELMGDCVQERDTICGFSGPFGPGLADINENGGTVDLSQAPDTLTITGSDAGGGGAVNTRVRWTPLKNGSLSFSYIYETNDGGGPSEDPFQINLLSGPTYDIVNSGPDSQGGSFNLAIESGDEFAIRIRSLDQMDGAATVKVFDWKFVFDSIGYQLDLLEGIASDSLFPIDSTLVRWQITLADSTKSECQWYVIVKDTISPTISCIPVTAYDPNDCEEFVSVTQPIVDDNCAVDSFYNTMNNTDNADGVYVVGDHDITWIVVDVNGNDNSCVQTVSVLDTVSPFISCLTDTMVISETDTCGAYIQIPQPLVSDNCIIDTVINNITGDNDASAFYPVGVTVVNWTVMDVNNNQNTCITTVTVQDTTAPVLMCPSSINVANDPDTCGAQLAITVPMLDEDCGLDTTYNTFTGDGLDASGFYPVDTTDVWFYVVDSSGLADSCMITVIVQDTTLPDIICPGDVLESNDLDSCNAFILIPEPDTSDNCSIDSVWNTRTGAGLDVSGTYPVDTTTVTWYVRDVNGLVDSCSIDVVVIDNEDPDLTCPPNMVLFTDPGVCNTFVNLVASATDNCGVDTIYSNLAGGADQSGTYDEGIYNIMWTVEDIYGNTDNCATLMSISDTNDLTITCPMNQVEVNDPGVCEAYVSIPLPDTSDNCGVMNVFNDYNLAFNASDTYPVGTTTVTWMIADDNGNDDTCSITVTVMDAELPVVNCLTDTTLYADSLGCAEFVGIPIPDTSDNCGVDSFYNDYTFTTDASAVYPLGETTVTWYIVDIYGNTDSCKTTVELLDTVNPVIVCPSDTMVNSDSLVCGAQITIPLPDTFDNCTIDSVYNDFNYGFDASGLYPIGTTKVTWTIVDFSGNWDTCSINVTVMDDEDPALICPPDMVVIVDSGECEILVTGLDAMVSDACGIDTVFNSEGGQENADGIYPVGLHHIVWTAIDSNTNVFRCTTLVDVVDTNSLYIECPNDTMVINDPGECSAYLDIPLPDTIDNCGILTVSNDYNLGFDASDTYPVDTTLVMWTIADLSGNTDSCSMTIIVKDTELPMIDCSPDTVIFPQAGMCEEFINLPLPDTSDNCGIDTLWNTRTGANLDASDTYPVGATPVTWYIRDIHGNLDSCTKLVTVMDTIPPTIVCFGSTTVGNDVDSCGAYLSLPMPTTDDNCLVDSVYNDYNGTDDASDFYPVGTTQVLWTVKDVSGNTDTCSITITVQDTSLPKITCPPNQLAFADPDMCSTFVNVPLPDTSDNCGIDSVYNNATGTFDASGVYTVGNTLVMWTIVDIHSNTNTCFTFINVQDTNNLEIVCPADVMTGVDPGECGAFVNIPFPDTSDNCMVTTVLNDYNNSNDASDFYPVGTTTVIWTIMDNSGNDDTCHQTVTVVDDENPMIDCPSDTTVYSTSVQCTPFVNLPLPDTSDNCGVDTVYNDFNGGFDASGVYPVGKTKVTWYIEDIHGNVDSCSTQVSVIDTISPVLSCTADISVSNDPGECGADLLVPGPSVADNCMLDTLYNDFNDSIHANGFYPVGTTVVTWTAIDKSDNRKTCSVTVTVDDTEDPQITCPGNIITYNDPGLCVADLMIAAPVYDDNCGIDSIYNDYNWTDDASDVYPVITTDVVFTLVDLSGNSNSCMFTVAVLDTNSLVITCPEDTVINLGMGECGPAFVNLPTPDTSDNCGINVVTNDKNGMLDASGVFPLGETTVTWTVSDQSGNVEMCSTKVTLLDGVDPSIDCPDDITAYSDPNACSATVNVPLPDTSDNCGVDTVYNSYTGAGLDASGTYFAGMTIVTWYLFDEGGNVDSCSTSITVIDTTTTPAIICPPDMTVGNESGECYADVTVPLPDTADNCGVLSVMNDFNGMFDASGQYPVGTTVVTWTVSYSGGTVDTCSTSVTVEDNEDPGITCPADITVDNEPDLCTADVTIALPDTSDNCGVASVVNDYNGMYDASDTYPAGTTTVTWTVTDVNGNMAQCSIDVVVNDVEDPEIDCPANITVDTDPGLCVADITIDLPDTSDNCDILSVTNSFNGQFDASDSYPKGATLVTWTIEDVNGNMNSCFTTVTVEDNEDPVITCPDDISVYKDEGECVADITIDIPATDDNCGLMSLINDYTGTGDASGTYPVGTTKVTWTVTDMSGNTDTCSIDVTVVDTITPYIECPGDVTVNTDPGVCEADITIALPDTSGNCNVDSAYNDYNGLFDASDVYPLGTTTVTWTLKDASGNTSRCQIDVTVVDEEDPVITCPADISMEADSGFCSADVTVPLPVYDDNCSVDTVYNTYTSSVDASGTYPVGVTKVTWTVVDGSGHSDTCSTTITVTETIDSMDLECGQLIPISLGPGCLYELGPEDILQGLVIGCPDRFSVNILDSLGNPIGNTVTEDDIGDTLMVQVIDSFMLPNNCFGSIIVLDDLPPVIECVSDTFECWNLEDVPPPYAEDYCEGPIDPVLVEETIEDSDCSDPELIRVVTRKYVAEDQMGNVSDTCTQLIYMRRIQLEDIEFPDSLTVAKGNALACNSDWDDPQGTPDPDLTGYPVIDSMEILPGVGLPECDLVVSFSDENLTQSNCTRKFRRTWTLTDTSCGGSRELTGVQMIEIQDTVPPVVTCPPDFTVTGTIQDCIGEVTIPPVMAFDDCTGILRVDMTIPVPPYMFPDQNGATFDLPIGHHSIMYTVYDSCLLSSSCFVKVTVADSTEPVPVCKQDLVISLPRTGKARVEAETFEDGSFDDCGIDSFAVARMVPGCEGSGTGFGPYVEFDCCDIAIDPLMIIVRVYDLSGNFNDCMVDVEVQDKIPPEFQCPSPVTISCEYPLDTSDMSAFGTLYMLGDPDSVLNPMTDPRADIVIDDPGNPDSPVNFGKEGYLYDNCEATFEESVVLDLDQCNVGYVYRTFTIYDAAGAVIDHCTQVIEVVNFDPFYINESNPLDPNDDVVWPADVTVYNMCSADDLDPDIFGSPDIDEDACDLVGIGYEDCTFFLLDPDDQACFKVLRKWKITDECQQENGEYKTWSHDQVIRFVNNNPPAFTTGSCDDVSVCSYDPTCSDTYIELNPSATDDCTPTGQLYWDYTIDLFNDGSFDLSPSQNPYADDEYDADDASGSYPIGTHKIYWEVEDRCGNKTTCSYIFDVKNCKTPVAICINTSTNLSLMDLDGDGTAETPMVMINAEFLDAASHHPCYDDVSISFSQDVTDTIRSYDCDYADSTVLVNIWVTDPNGLQDFCVAALTIQDNNDLCPDSPQPIGNITGQIFTPNGQMLGDASVFLGGSSQDLDTTDMAGDYAFTNANLGGSYVIDPSKNDDFLNGVTTYDLALIQRHILDLQSFDNPYQYIAADVDHNENINVLDIVELRKLILGIIDEFTHNESWRFIDANHVFVTNNPLTEDFSESYSIPQFLTDMAEINFIAVKIGDVNFNAEVNAAGAEDRSLQGIMPLEMDNISLVAGAEYRLPVRVADATELLGFQFTLDFEAELIQWSDVQPSNPLMNGDNFNQGLSDRGMIPVSWHLSEYRPFAAGEELFELRFTAKRNSRLYDVFSIASSITPAEAYTRDGIQDVKLVFSLEKPVPEALTFELMQNVPNPFYDLTTIGYVVPEDMETTLVIMDVHGKELMRLQQNARAGYNEYIVRTQDLGESRGVYYYSLRSGSFTATKKMILTK